MINTNGKRIAHDDRFLAQLNEVRPSLYFQFDGFDRETYRIIRGEPDILEEKLRALDRLAAIGLNVTLVPAIERGVNEHEVGKIIEFAIRASGGARHQLSAGVSRWPPPAARSHAADDHPGHPAADRSANRRQFVVSDFIPVPCCFPTCNSVTYAFIDGEKVTPLPRIVNVVRLSRLHHQSRHAGFQLEIKRALEGLWSSSSVPGSQKSARAVRRLLPGLRLAGGPDRRRHRKAMLMIMLQDFMDPWTFNQKNLMKCCKEFLLPGGKQSPVLRLQHDRLPRAGPRPIGSDGTAAQTGAP